MRRKWRMTISLWIIGCILCMGCGQKNLTESGDSGEETPGRVTSSEEAPGALTSPEEETPGTPTSSEGKLKRGDYTWEGIIIKCNGTSLLVADYGEEGNESYVSIASVGISNAQLADEDGKAVKAEQLEVGMPVTITFNGNVAESYPCQIGADTVEIAGEKNDLVGMYLALIDEMLENDSALNDEITYIGLDLTGVTNLTEGQKEAVAYLLWCDTGYQVLRATYEELAEQLHRQMRVLHGEELDTEYYPLYLKLKEIAFCLPAGDLEAWHRNTRSIVKAGMERLRPELQEAIREEYPNFNFSMEDV